MASKRQVVGEVEIDVSLIPDPVRDNLVSPLYQILKDYFEQPGMREECEIWKKEYKKEQRLKRKEQKRHETRKIPARISD